MWFPCLNATLLEWGQGHFSTFCIGRTTLLNPQMLRSHGDRRHNGIRQLWVAEYLHLQALREVYIKVACFQSLSRSYCQYKALQDVNYQQEERWTQPPHSGSGEQESSCCTQNCCGQSQASCKTSSEFCQQHFTGTDAPKHTINVYPLENEPGLGEFCTSPFIHSYMHIAKMLVSGQGAWGQLLAIFILPCTVNKNCNCSAVQGLYPSQQSPRDFFGVLWEFFVAFF